MNHPVRPVETATWPTRSDTPLISHPTRPDNSSPVIPDITSGTVSRWETTRLIPTRPPRQPIAWRNVWRRIRLCLIAIGYLLGLAALGGLTWLTILAVLAVITLVTTVVTAIASVITWIGAHLFLLAVLGIAVLFFGGKTACEGIHCGGCRK